MSPSKHYEQLVSAIIPDAVYADPMPRSERHRLQCQVDSLRAKNKAKDRQISDLSERLKKMGKVAHVAIDRAEVAESQLAELRGRIEPMALVYPWLKEEVSARSARPERKA